MRSFLASIALVWTACAAQPHCELPPRVASAAPFLWRVQRANGPVVWLYGTIHDAGEDEVPAAARSALDHATHFASELGDVEPDPAQLAELARLPFGKVLDQLLSADDWWELVDAMRGAMSEDELRHAAPWFAMTRLTSHVAPSPRPSMDVALATRARDRGIPVDALESWSEQMTALAKAVDAKDLAEAIHARKTIACDLAQLRAAYDNSDEPTLARLLQVRDQATLIAARNDAWRGKLEAYAAADGAFVAVGLGHLLGAGGLPETLAHAGYTVERAR